MPLDVTSTTEERVPIKFAPKTTAGKPSKVEGAPVVEITSGAATAQQATPEELEQGIAGYVVSEDVPGTSTYSVTADSDLGPEVRTIVDGGTYTYNDPFADNLGLSAGTAVPK